MPGPRDGLAQIYSQFFIPGFILCVFVHKGRCAGGPKADLKLRMLDARFSPVSGHYQLDQSCPESANNRSRSISFDHLVNSGHKIVGNG
jgi:hypothetical protein